MHVAAMPAQIAKPGLAAETAAMAGPPFPSAIPAEEIDLMGGRCAETVRGLSLRCPSIYPNFRYRLVLLHERCAYLNGILLLEEFETQTPAAGCRIRPGNDVLDLGLLCGHNATQDLWIDGFQPVADQVQHEQRGAIASCSDAGSGKSRQRGRLWGIQSPVQPVGIDVFAFCLQNCLGLPKARNIVVNFFLGRNFDQFNRTFAPVSDRLRPQTWPAFETGLEVLVGKEVLLTLQQP